MKVQCGHCPAKYAVADERVRDKKVRIRCRRCNAAIVVDGKVSPPLVTSTPARPSAGPDHPALESLPPSNPPTDHPRPVAHTIMGGLEAPVTHELMHAHVEGAAARAEAAALEERALGKPDSSRGFTAPPVRGDVERWRVALTQQDLRWMTTEEIVQAFKDGAVKSETFVFRAGMPTWVTLLEVTEIAQALADARLVSPPLRTLRLEEPDPLSPPKRNSSLPPPRKPARQPAASPLTELIAAATDGIAEPEESLPFALVAERGSKRPESASAAEPASSAASNGSSPAAAELAAPAAAASEDAHRENDAAPAAARPNAAEPNGAAEPARPVPAPEAPAAPEAAAPPAPAPLAPPSLEAAVAPLPRKSSAWIWISLVVLVALAAAVFLLGPRFGLRLG